MEQRRSPLAVAILNLVAFAGVIVVNALATTIPLGGKTPGELSDAYPNLFVPAGITFSIWGLIYLLLVIFVVYALVLAIRGREEGFSGRVGVLFLVTCLANMGWIFAWQYRVLPLSLAFMLVLLAALIMLYLRLDIGLGNAGKAERFIVHLPFSVYLGWISVATIANITALLVAYKWNRFGAGEQAWTVVVMLVAIALGIVFSVRRKDIFYALVIDWAMLGIYLKRSADSAVPAQLVTGTALFGIAVLTIGIVVQVFRRKIY